MISLQQLSAAITGLLESADTIARKEIIEDLLHQLNFEKRLAGLTKRELHAMENVHRLSNAQRNKISGARNEKERDAIITGYARAQYFVDCMWADYLNGVTDRKPWDESIEGKQNARAALSQHTGDTQ